jgi:ribonuclease D
MMAISPEEFGALLGTVFMGSGMLVLVRAWARKIENQSKLPKAPAESAERMERMERAIDSVAVEVERISENQRFLTKLLAERAAGAPAGSLQRPDSPRGDSP